MMYQISNQGFGKHACRSRRLIRYRANSDITYSFSNFPQVLQ